MNFSVAVAVPRYIRPHAGGDLRGATTKLCPRTLRETFRPLVDAYLLHHGDHDLSHPETGMELARREAGLLDAWRESNE